jgi:hypothetical protein
MKRLLEQSAVEQVIFPLKALKKEIVKNEEHWSALFFAVFSRTRKQLRTIEFPMLLHLPTVRNNVPYYLHFEYVTTLSFEVCNCGSFGLCICLKFIYLSLSDYSIQFWAYFLYFVLICRII